MSLTWLVWRQSRLAVISAAIALAAFALLILIDGIHLHPGDGKLLSPEFLASAEGRPVNRARPLPRNAGSRVPST